MMINLSTLATWGLLLVPDPRLATIVELSTWNTTWWPSQDSPHRIIAWSTAYISLNCMSLLLKQHGHRVENHSSPNIPPRPFSLLASVYTCRVGFGGSRM